jgi:hypothetical protein
MILALAMALQAAKVDVEIVPPVNPGVVSVEALMKLPTTGPVDRADFALLREAILDDTAEYGHRQLVNYTAGTGESIRCDLYPDCLRIRFGVSLGDASAAIDILANVIHDSELKEDAINTALTILPFRRHDYWAGGLDPEPLTFQGVSLKDIKTLYSRIGRADNIYLTIAAPQAVGDDLADRWRRKTAEWELPSSRPFAPDHSPQKMVGQRAGNLTTIVLRGHPIDPTGSAISAQLLAIFALGSGKGSATWTALREGLGWSYRQEALLRNSQTGLEPVIEVVTAKSDADTDRALAVRPALMKAVAAWTDADVTRALGSAKALFERGVGMNPLYFKSTRPVGDDSLFLRTYWRMKTGVDWDSVTFLLGMANVTLKDLQAAATEMLDGANVEIIRGRD